MEKVERRREKRLRYHWPIWFAEDFNSVLAQGQMIDICSGGAAFTCYSQECPQAGREITARFSIPQFAGDASFDLSNFIRTGEICRVEDLNPFMKRVAVKFDRPLPFKPGEQNYNDSLAEEPVRV